MASRYLIALLFFLASATAEAQVQMQPQDTARTKPQSASSPTIRITGYVVDIYDRNPISGVSVIMPKLGQSMVTDGTGHFTVTCGKKDTLFLFLYGYQTMRFSMADSALKDKYHPVFEFDRLVATISKPIIVRPKPRLDQIDKEREKMGQIPKDLQQPNVPITSPISALYEMLSGRAKERSKLRDQMVADERERIYKELFDYYKESGLFDLPDEYYDQFIRYLDLPVDFLKHNTDYTITKTILDAYKKFGLEKGFIK